MHKNQRVFCEELKGNFPHFFEKKRVFEVGSLDINGNNRYLFNNCDHVGIDVISGPNVDCVCIAHEYESDEKFGVVFSTNSLEHDMHYKKTLKKMYDLLEDEGLMFFTVSLLGEHGTTNSTPDDSGTAKIDDKEWNTFYKKFAIEDFKETMDFRNFLGYGLGLFNGFDIVFWGIKKENK